MRAAEKLESELNALAAVRAGAPPPLLNALKRWQSARLSRTYADLAADPRYAAASDFFFGELYGAVDVGWRDDSVVRMLPAMKRMLPEPALDTVALAIRLDLLSEQLDRRVAASNALANANSIDEERYAAAYREAGTAEEREAQIAIIITLGERLDRLVHHPLVVTGLKMMRGPAKVAGLGPMQSFLERGVDAFRAMKGAETFLSTIATREREIAKRLFSSQPAPFSLP